MPHVLIMEAEQNLRASQVECSKACARLEAESAIFLASERNTERQVRRFNLIYRLLNYEIQSQSEHFYSVLQHKLAAMALIQGMVGESPEDEDVRKLTIAVKQARLMDCTVRLIERGIEAMRELNGRRGQRIDDPPPRDTSGREVHLQNAAGGEPPPPGMVERTGTAKTSEIGAAPGCSGGHELSTALRARKRQGRDGERDVTSSGQWSAVYRRCSERNPWTDMCASWTSTAVLKKTATPSQVRDTGRYSEGDDLRPHKRAALGLAFGGSHQELSRDERAESSPVGTVGTDDTSGARDRSPEAGDRRQSVKCSLMEAGGTV